MLFRLKMKILLNKLSKKMLPSYFFEEKCLHDSMKV